MKQLISRIDDDLHRRLKARAAKENRSVNDFVVEILSDAVDDAAASWRRRLERSGLRIAPSDRSGRRPSWEDVLDAYRGTGTAISEALTEERSER